MRGFRLIHGAAIAAACLITATIPQAAPPALAASIIHVPGDYPTIQAGIDAADAGDTVLVAPGTYAEAITIQKSIVLESEGGAEATTIDGSAAWRAAVEVYTGWSTSPVLRGFTIVGAAYGGVNLYGDGMTHGAVLVEENRIVDTPDGPGVSVQYADATIRGNLISANGMGVAIAYPSSPLIVGNTITGNGGSARGGGISVGGTATATIDGNVISGNTASDGGGITVHDADALITNNIISDNVATHGGGVYLHTNDGYAGPRLVNNTIANNTAVSGSALYLSRAEPSTSLVNNLLAASSTSAAVACDSSYGGDIPEYLYNEAWNAAGPAYEGVCPTWTGSSGNVSVDPRMVDPAHGRYHLRPDSPLVDAGLNAGAPSTDVDGEVRPHDGDEDGSAVVDIGADEATDPVLIAPGSLAFGSVGLGVAVGPVEIEIGNLGIAPLAVSTVALSGPDAADFTLVGESCAGTSLAVGARCTVTVGFNPSAIAPRTAALTITGPSPVGSRTVPLEGEGLDPIGVSPASIDFGPVGLRFSAPGHIMTLSNTGGTAVTIETIAIAGPGADDFTVVSEDCTAAPVAPASSCTVNVGFRPTTLGERIATIGITGPSPVDVRTVALAGEGIQPPSGVTWGATYRAGPGYTWNSGNALGRTVQSGAQRLHLAYATNRVNGRWAGDRGPYAGIYYTKSSTGSAWTTPFRVNPKSQHALRVGLAAYGSRVYAAWATQTRITRYSGTAPRVLYVRVNTNHGASSSWKSPVRLTSTSGRVDYPVIAAYGYDVHVAYTNSAKGSVRVASSRDRGATWKTLSLGTTSYATSSGRMGYPSVAASGSTVVVAWLADKYGTIRARISTNRGVSWGAAVTLASNTQGVTSVATRGDRIAVAWTTADEVVVRQRVAGTWSPPAVVAALPAGASSSPYSPAVLLQDSGRIGIAWSEAATSTTSNLRWAESADGGSTWFTTQTLAATSSSRRLNDWPSVLWPSAATRYVAWNGWTASSTNYRLYIRKGSGAPIGPTSVAPAWTPNRDALPLVPVGEGGRSAGISPGERRETPLAPR